MRIFLFIYIILPLAVQFILANTGTEVPSSETRPISEYTDYNELPEFKW